MAAVLRSWLARRTWGIPTWYVMIAIVVLTSFAITQSLPILGLLGLLLVPKLQQVNLLSLYVFMVFTIPLSTELYLPLGLGTDLPVEQFMWFFTGAGLVQFWWAWPRVPMTIIRHPVTLFMTLIPFWILITSITSIDSVQSIKYLLAKLWYTISMFYMAIYLLREPKALRRGLKWLVIATIITVILILMQHSFWGFSFESVNKVLKPFYRNHVDYACLVVLVIPYIVWYRSTICSLRMKRAILLTIVVLAIAVMLSYTRAAIIAGILSPMVYLLIRQRLILPAIVTAALLVLGGTGYMLKDYRYMSYAPDFNTTIHHKDFGNLLAATADGSDVSTMERYHRWIAGYAMFQDRPWMGFGPSNFVRVYERFTNKHFRTWASDNEERSGIHNYYLMLLVEQGLPGLFIFILMNICAFLRGQWDYHRLRDPVERGLIMAALTSIFVTLLICGMNDMIESMKVGTIYFISLAILVRAGWIVKNKPTFEEENSSVTTSAVN